MRWLFGLSLEQYIRVSKHPGFSYPCDSGRSAAHSLVSESGSYRKMERFAHNRARDRRLMRTLAAACGAALLLAACGAPELAPTPQPTALPTAPSAAPSEVAATPGTGELPCRTGTLLVGDLPAMDRAWQAGIARATAKALAWQQDAVISDLRVACQLFETDFRWQATFYSADAQAFFASDTGEVTPSGVESDKVPQLPVRQLSFGLVYRSLTAAGFADDAEISPSTGVDIRLNTENMPFGPPEAPKGIILYHVSIDRLGEANDVFVDGRDGTVLYYSNR